MKNLLLIGLSFTLIIVGCGSDTDGMGGEENPVFDNDTDKISVAMGQNDACCQWINVETVCNGFELHYTEMTCEEFCTTISETNFCVDCDQRIVYPEAGLTDNQIASYCN